MSLPNNKPQQPPSPQTPPEPNIHMLSKKEIGICMISYMIGNLRGQQQLVAQYDEYIRSIAVSMQKSENLTDENMEKIMEELGNVIMRLQLWTEGQGQEPEKK